jgi:hypothetical protein
MKSWLGRLAPALLAVTALVGATLVVASDSRAADPVPDAAPRAKCGPGSRPETGRQGRVPLAEAESGRSLQGYTCNTERLSTVGKSGGYKVERYVDKAGHECAYFDTTLAFPIDVGRNTTDLSGTFVMDMSNPAKPVRTETLLTPAMQSPHETLALHQKRGLLVAVTSNPAFYPGVIDVYDVTADCRHPKLVVSAPIAVFGHEGGFSADGLTYYVASLYGRTLAAIDLSNPVVPRFLWLTDDYESHGVSTSSDGNRLYVAERTRGLIILDVSEIQARKANPVAREVSVLTWPTRSTPQINIPVTLKGRPHLIEMDEFGSALPGAARIIDISNERKPKVISDIRLEVHDPENRPSQMSDPGADFALQGYAGHYCNVATRVDPDVVACTFIMSGVRLFDIRDPRKPKEIAYFNQPGPSKAPGSLPSAYAMSSPVLVPERNEIWYSDGNSGFHAVKVANRAWPRRK